MLLTQLFSENDLKLYTKFIQEMNVIEYFLCMIFLMQIVQMIDTPNEYNNKVNNDILLLCNRSDVDCVVHYLY